MFKVSFKNQGRFPAKRVQRFSGGKVTVVTLKGAAQLPVFSQHYIPKEVYDWVEACKNVEATFTLTHLYLTATGKSKRAEGDADDPVLAERVAECRAKINLYKFMVNLTSKLLVYYGRLLSTNTSMETHKGDDTIEGANLKYCNLYSRELAHLKALLTHEPHTEGTPQP